MSGEEEGEAAEEASAADSEVAWISHLPRCSARDFVEEELAC